jgi:hypothetical protein
MADASDVRRQSLPRFIIDHSQEPVASLPPVVPGAPAFANSVSAAPGEFPNGGRSCSTLDHWLEPVMARRVAPSSDE